MVLDLLRVSRISRSADNFGNELWELADANGRVVARMSLSFCGPHDTYGNTIHVEAENGRHKHIVIESHHRNIPPGYTKGEWAFREALFIALFGVGLTIDQNMVLEYARKHEPHWLDLS